MRSKLRNTFATAAAAALVLGTAGVAIADNVVADGDNVEPVDNNALSLGTVCVEDSVTQNALVAVSRNGKYGSTNVFKDGSTVTVTVVGVTGPGLSAVMDPAPATITLTGWAGADNNSMSAAVGSKITFVAGAAPTSFSGTVIYRATGIRDNGATLTRDGSLAVSATVSNTGACAPAPSNTPPTVSVSGFEDGAEIEIGDHEPTTACEVTDAEDENPSATPVTDRSALVNGMGPVTVTCEYTDGGGMSDSDTKTYTLVDTTDPTINHSISGGPDGENGWYVTAPTVTFTCEDTPGSGIQSCVADDADPASASYTLGESASAQSVSGTATDWAGNTATDEATGLYVDLSDPYDVVFSGGPEGDMYFGEVPAEPTCSAQDDISGLANCEVTGYSTAVGSHTMTATATDKAGRTATATQSYEVKAWTLDGFYRPVDMDKLNTVKAGSTVPLKFNVFKGSDPVTDIEDLDATFSIKRTACEIGIAVDALDEFSTTGGTTLRYDADGQQWVQNWATPKGGKGNCYLVTVTTADGSEMTADFKLK
jgi:hypothetical protein